MVCLSAALTVVEMDKYLVENSDVLMVALKVYC